MRPTLSCAKPPDPIITPPFVIGWVSQPLPLWLRPPLFMSGHLIENRRSWLYDHYQHRTGLTATLLDPIFGKLMSWIPFFHLPLHNLLPVLSVYYRRKCGHQRQSDAQQPISEAGAPFHGCWPVSTNIYRSSGHGDHKRRHSLPRTSSISSVCRLCTWCGF
jgi:hypothetical protein